MNAFRITTCFALLLLATVATGCTKQAASSERATEAGELSQTAAALWKQSQVGNEANLQLAMQDGVVVRPTPDGESFSLEYTPPACADAKPACPVIVSLHGHAGWALDGHKVWRQYAIDHSYRVVNIQWWNGTDDLTESYYSPSELYAQLKPSLEAMDAQASGAVLHGFSRGSTQVYALTALDRATAHPVFDVTIANAGGWISDYPPTAEIERGQYGSTPLKGSKWVLFCGGRDPFPQRDGCPAMSRTGEQIKAFAGTVLGQVQDPTGDHGSMHLVAKNADQVLDLADAALGRSSL